MSAPGDSTPCFAASDAVVDPEPQERLVVSIVREDADWSAFDHPEDAVRRAASALIGHAGSTLADGAEVAVVLASDAIVRRLNATYRGKDCATNVLSFAFQAPPGTGMEASGELGDVVLAAETIVVEARERAIRPEVHLQHLVVHGILHLLGLDHDTDAAAERMERLETEILATLGIADPYAHAAAEA